MPRAMLDCAAWTLTHSSAGAGELAVALELVPPLGLVVMRPSRDAVVVVPEAEDADAEPVPVETDAEPVSVEADAEPVPVAEPVRAGDDDSGGEVVAGPLNEGVTVGDGVGEGVGDGEGDGEGEGDGDGMGGSAWHTTFAAAGVFPCGVSGAACALPTAPRVRKPPLSTVTAVTRTCPKRIRIACPR